VCWYVHRKYNKECEGNDHEEETTKEEENINSRVDSEMNACLQLLQQALGMVLKREDGDALSTIDWERCKAMSTIELKEKELVKICGIDLKIMEERTNNGVDVEKCGVMKLKEVLWILAMEIGKGE